MNSTRLNDFLHRKEEEDRQKNCILWILAIIGVVAAVALIAYGVYRFFTPDYLEDFEDDFEDDFDDDFFEDEEKPAVLGYRSHHPLESGAAPRYLRRDRPIIPRTTENTAQSAMTVCASIGGTPFQGCPGAAKHRGHDTTQTSRSP